MKKNLMNVFIAIGLHIAVVRPTYFSAGAKHNPRDFFKEWNSPPVQPRLFSTLDLLIKVTGLILFKQGK